MNTMLPKRLASASVVAALLMTPAGAGAQDGQGAQEQAPAPDNGTDPTRVRSTAIVSIEHLDLRQGFTQETLKFTLALPLAGHTSLQASVPFVSNDAAGSEDLVLSDVGLKITHIPKVTRQYGIVTQAEVVFDTADRPEAGSGQTVLKGTFIYARFLKGGSIFAPSFQQSYGFGRDTGRARVSSSTLDLYYVPKLANPRLFVTIDPSFTYDWTADDFYPALSVTVGHSLGPALGGTTQAYVKPTIVVGSNRPANWGVEIGVKVLGF